MLKVKQTAEAIRSAVLVERTVFANFECLPEGPVELGVQSSRVPMVQCERASIEKHSFARRNKLNTDALNEHVKTQPREDNPGDRVAVWVNHLMDWALPGTQTVQIMMVRRELPCKVEIQRPLIVDANEPGLHFQALLGTHRAKATLRVQFLHLESGATSENKVEFDLTSRGGRHVKEYQNVSVPVPPGKGRVEVRLSVAYSGYADDGTGSEPFLFISDVHVGPQNEAAVGRTPTPLVLAGETVPIDGVWMSAKLPATAAPDGLLEVQQGQEKQSFFLPRRADVDVDDSYGHSLVLDAHQPEDLSLYVDGKHDLSSPLL